MFRRGNAVGESDSRSAFDLALGAEVRAARIEAALQMDPVVAAQWRAEVGVAEAAASVGLEDVRISEPDLLIRISENTGRGIEARAVEDALAILRFIRAPGDVRARPAETIDRIDQLAMRDADAEGALESEDLADIFDACLGRAPVIEAIRAAAEFAWRTDRRSPVAERMVFMAAEHASRGLSGGKAYADEDPMRGLGGRFNADWVSPPSLALTQLQFRIWSPSNPSVIRDLLCGVERVLAQEQGRVISIRRWRDRLDEVSRRRHGRSRLADAGAAFGIEPFLTSRALADRIGVTQRGALNLLAELTGLGLIEEMTRRRAARIWATPGLARLLAPPSRMPGRAAARSLAGSKSHEAAPEVPEKADVRADRTLKEEGRASMAEAMAEFDRTLAKVDAILGRLPARR